MTGTAEDSWEELNLAAICGLLRRFGPSPSQLAGLPWWRRTACRLLPRQHRWRAHPLAPHIRNFENCISSSST